ncbi:MAG TPA: protein kinase, partial [Kofleriaceae bacterium]
MYAATDELLGRQVAVKTVTVRGGTSDLFKRRFLNEARAVAALSHPNIVPIFDLGFEDDVPFIVMELAPGPTLKDRIADAPLSPGEVRQLGIQLAQALKAAHGRRIIHRDVKPANVLESEPGVWKLVDFGVAHVPDSSLTMTGQFVGSVAYAAPESLALGQIAATADIYGLGATLYEAASGERAHDEASVSSLTALLARPAPRPLHEVVPGFPRELSAAILQALAADAEQRPTATELANLLASADASPARAPATAKPRWLLAAIAVIAVSGSAIAVTRAMRSDDPVVAVASPAPAAARAVPTTTSPASVTARPVPTTTSHTPAARATVPTTSTEPVPTRSEPVAVAQPASSPTIAAAAPINPPGGADVPGL